MLVAIILSSQPNILTVDFEPRKLAPNKLLNENNEEMLTTHLIFHKSAASTTHLQKFSRKDTCASVVL